MPYGDGVPPRRKEGRYAAEHRPLVIHNGQARPLGHPFALVVIGRAVKFLTDQHCFVQAMNTSAKKIFILSLG